LVMASVPHRESGVESVALPPCRPRAAPLPGQVPPRNARSIPIDDPLDNHPVVAKRVALSARVRRQQRLDAFPLLIGQGVLTRRRGSAHLSIIPRTQPHISETRYRTASN